MPYDDMQEAGLVNAENSPPTPSQEQYSIHIDVTADGLSIDGEEPVDLRTALKTIIAIVKAHPMTDDAHEQLQAGYESA